jgi:hypothetical protein
LVAAASPRLMEVKARIAIALLDNMWKLYLNVRWTWWCVWIWWWCVLVGDWKLWSYFSFEWKLRLCLQAIVLPKSRCVSEPSMPISIVLSKSGLRTTTHRFLTIQWCNWECFQLGKHASKGDGNTCLAPAAMECYWQVDAISDDLLPLI